MFIASTVSNFILIVKPRVGMLNQIFGFASNEDRADYIKKRLMPNKINFEIVTTEQDAR